MAQSKGQMICKPIPRLIALIEKQLIIIEIYTSDRLNIEKRWKTTSRNFHGNSVRTLNNKVVLNNSAYCLPKL